MHNMARRVAFRRRRQNTLGIFCVTLVVLMVLIVFTFKGHELRQKQLEYQEREATLTEQIDRENQRALDLVEYEKYTKTAKYVEEVAKDKLGLVYEDEIIFESEDGQ